MPMPGSARCRQAGKLTLSGRSSDAGTIRNSHCSERGTVCYDRECSIERSTEGSEEAQSEEEEEEE